MALKILHVFIVCFAVAGLLNLGNFFVCYYIHVNKIAEKDEWSYEEIPEPSTSKWDDKLRSLLICGTNSSNCANAFSSETFFTEASKGETTEMFNGFYYYIHDADLSNIRFCPKVPPGLGPVEMDESLIELNAFDEMFSYLKSGGLFIPMHCIPRQSVAIIVPIQDDLQRIWKNYIGTFLFYIHLFLMKQLLEYQLFIIIQVGNPKKPFARGKLLNIGFIESQKMRRNGWDCLVFHDAYYIPTDTRNLYRCTNQPRRLIALTDGDRKFGGVAAVRPSVLRKVNGFSNLIWYNDGDYVNMYQRLSDWNYSVETTPSYIGQYTTLKFYPHMNLSRPGLQSREFHATTPIHLIDGLSSLSYRIVNAGWRQLFTFIEVDINYQE